MMRAGSALAPVTCGELVQGSLGGLDFLVSCPINLFSRADVWVETDSSQSQARGSDNPSGDGAEIPSLEVLPPSSHGGGQKAVEAVRLTLRALGARVRSGNVRIRCPVPAGKGLGSSTADIVAAIFATARALNTGITPQVAARIALSVEPSDSIMFPGLALFDHRRGRIMRPLGPPPPLKVLVLDTGGELDTGEFNRRPDLAIVNARKEPVATRALAMIIEGIRQGNPFLLGQGATMSALAHQKVLPKEGLEDLVARAHGLGAYGVVVAHSGTAVGVLLPTEAEGKRVSKYLERTGYSVLLESPRLVGGGDRLARQEEEGDLDAR